jgi:hypothetical protein
MKGALLQRPDKNPALRPALDDGDIVVGQAVELVDYLVDVKNLFAFVGFFEFAYIQFARHAKHRRANPIRFSRVGIAHHDVQAFRHDLPR